MLGIWIQEEKTQKCNFKSAMKKKLGKETDSKVVMEIKKEKQDDDVRFCKPCLAKEIGKIYI